MNEYDPIVFKIDKKRLQELHDHESKGFLKLDCSVDEVVSYHANMLATVLAFRFRKDDPKVFKRYLKDINEQMKTEAIRIYKDAQYV